MVAAAHAARADVDEDVESQFAQIFGAIAAGIIGSPTPAGVTGVGEPLPLDAGGLLVVVNHLRQAARGLRADAEADQHDTAAQMYGRAKLAFSAVLGRCGSVREWFSGASCWVG